MYTSIQQYIEYMNMNSDSQSWHINEHRGNKHREKKLNPKKNLRLEIVQEMHKN